MKLCSDNLTHVERFPNTTCSELPASGHPARRNERQYDHGKAHNQAEAFCNCCNRCCTDACRAARFCARSVELGVNLYLLTLARRSSYAPKVERLRQKSRLQAHHAFIF